MAGYNFDQKLRFSLGEREKLDLELLKPAILGCVTVFKTSDTIDKSGIDYIAVLRGGTRIQIDAKTREKGCSRFWKNGPELALEIWSKCPSESKPGVTGWTLKEDGQVDMILYTFDPEDSGEFYLLPFQHLRMAFRKNYKDWTARFKKAYQPNDGYKSEAVFVPATVVLDAIREEMRRKVA